jgi:ABC-type cobalamin/Fe3+-siderophores transport system ATPase subunit
MLETKTLSFSLKNKVLLNSTSLSFGPGLHVLVGPNGSGKTTFLKTLVGLFTPTEGKVLWQGENLHQKPRLEISKIVTSVFATSAPLFGYTVEEFVSMGRYMWGDVDSTLTKKALDRVGATQFLKRPITELSQGERQRIYLARALITEAPVMLLDEPCAHLDLRYKYELWQLLKDLAEEGKTIITVTHDIECAKRYSEAFYLWHKGICLKFGTMDEVLTSQSLQEIFELKSYRT